MKKLFLLVAFFSFSAASSFAAATGQSGNAYQFYLKALLLESQGNFTSAYVEVQRALELAPDSAYLHRTAAELLLRLGQIEKAGEEIEKAVELDPKDVQALIISGQINWAIGNSDIAIERLRRALTLDPDESEALVSLAGALTPKNPKEAIKLYKDFLVRHPNEGEIRERLAQVYQATNELDKAKAEWASVLALSPNSVRGHLALAQIAEINFDTATAIAHYEGVLSQDPTNLPLLLRVGELRYRSDDMGKAFEAFSKAQAVAPTSPGANFWLALLAENRGDWLEAIKHLKNVPESGREPGILLRLSYYYSQAGQFKEAIKALKQLSDLDPANTDFLNYLAAAYEQDGQTASAEKVLKRIIDIDPNDPEAHFRLGTLYDRTGRFPKAEEQMRAAIRLKPEFHVALNYLGYSFADKNIHLDEAEQLIMDAIALDPGNPAYLDSMGWVYFRQGKLAKAKDFLREATEQARDATIWDHYGDVWMADGQVQEAILAWDEALRISPKAKGLRGKVDKALGQLSKTDKVGLFMKRALANFGDIQSIDGLTRISACETGPCAKSNAQFHYERGAVLQVEIPGPLAGPVLQVVKKPGAASKFGALHPLFQAYEFYVTRAFDRLEPLLSGDLFKEADLQALGANASEKSGRLTVKSGAFQIVFNGKTGAVKSLSWDDGEALETFVLGDYPAPRSAEMPKFIEWQYSRPAFRLRLEFQSPAITRVP